MQVRYTVPHGQFVPGDVVDIPDGAEFSADYLEPVTAAADSGPDPEPEDPAPDPAPADAPRLPYPEEM